MSTANVLPSGSAQGRALVGPVHEVGRPVQRQPGADSNDEYVIQYSSPTRMIGRVGAVAREDRVGEAGHVVSHGDGCRGRATRRRPRWCAAAPASPGWSMWPCPAPASRRSCTSTPAVRERRGERARPTGADHRRRTRRSASAGIRGPSPRPANACGSAKRLASSPRSSATSCPCGDVGSSHVGRQQAHWGARAGRPARVRPAAAPPRRAAA